MKLPGDSKNLKFLIIRRDNIGDLVCTTPAISALRKRYPEAMISVFVNSYNQAVIQHHPDIDHVYVYTKEKHRKKGESLLAIFRERLRVMRSLKKEKFDYAIIAGSGFQRHALQMARAIKPRHIVAYTDPKKPVSKYIDIGITADNINKNHQVESIFRLLEPLGIIGKPPRMLVCPDPGTVKDAEKKIREQKWPVQENLIGIHISTRKDTNRWPKEKFIELIKRLYREYQAGFLLLWPPGESTNPRHPGDDDTADHIVKALPDIPVIAYPMGPLEQLIADLSFCKTVITSDGGALHIAAALGKPILCFFGDVDSRHWYPWGVPHVLLQPSTRHAADISVDDALAGYQRLLALQKGKGIHPYKTSSGT